MRPAAIIALIPLWVCLAAEPEALPEGPQKTLVANRCKGCHPAEVLLGRLDTPKNWARKVESMINRGAELSDDDVAQINAYLNEHFALVPENVTLPDGPGKEALQKACSTCHPAEVVANRGRHTGLRWQWSNTVDQMMVRGAHANAAEQELIVDYLTKNFGYIPVRSYLPEGPGKQTTERVCGPCHGVLMLLDRRRAGGAWSGTVTNMIRRGAEATPDEANDIARYLGTYLTPTNAPK
jgi:cytochrome c553